MPIDGKQAVAKALSGPGAAIDFDPRPLPSPLATRARPAASAWSRRAASYSEGAHIRPLGKPHDGPDQPDNVLCPNCHVLFGAGAFAIRPDTLDLVGKLQSHRRPRRGAGASGVSK